MPLPLQLIPQYERQAKELEEQVQTFELLREMEEKVQQLEKELQWALVIEIEKVSEISLEGRGGGRGWGIKFKLKAQETYIVICSNSIFSLALPPGPPKRGGWRGGAWYLSRE